MLSQPPLCADDLLSALYSPLQVWDAARTLLQLLEARPQYLTGRPAVLELGSGTGWLGMTLACRFGLSEMVMTEAVEGGALEWLSLNLKRNEHLPISSCRVAALDWAWAEHPPSGPNCPELLLDRQWDVVLGSDLVYNEVGVEMLPRVLAALARPGTCMLYAHTLNRFEFMDHDFLRALWSSGLSFRLVWPAEEEAQEAAQVWSEGSYEEAEELGEPGRSSSCSLLEPSGELFPDMRIVVLQIQRAAHGHKAAGPGVTSSIHVADDDEQRGPAQSSGQGHAT